MQSEAGPDRSVCHWAGHHGGRGASHSPAMMKSATGSRYAVPVPFAKAAVYTVEVELIKAELTEKLLLPSAARKPFGVWDTEDPLKVCEPLCVAHNRRRGSARGVRLLKRSTERVRQ